MEPKRGKRKVRHEGADSSPSYQFPSNYIKNRRLIHSMIKIVKAMGGEMWIESDGHSKGTTVWFRLPSKQP